MKKIAFIDEYWDDSDFKDEKYVERYLENLSLIGRLRERYDLNHIKGLNSNRLLELWKKRKEEKYDSVIVDFPLSLDLYIYQRDFFDLEKRSTLEDATLMHCSVRLGCLRDIYDMGVADKIIVFKDYIDGVRHGIKFSEHEIDHVIERKDGMEIDKNFFSLIRCIESNNR